MKNFARIKNNKIINLEVSDINTSPEDLIDITNIIPTPKIGYGYDSSSGNFIPNPQCSISSPIQNPIILSEETPTLEINVKYSEYLTVSPSNHLMVTNTGSFNISNFTYNSESNSSTFTLSTGSELSNISDLLSSTESVTLPSMDSILTSTPLTTPEGIDFSQNLNVSIIFS